MILEYEIMKYDGDLGRPNLFVPLTQEVCQNKIGSLLEIFPSQTKRQWFNEEAFWSLLRLRGIECNAPTGLPKHSSRARYWLRFSRGGSTPKAPSACVPFSACVPLAKRSGTAPAVVPPIVNASKTSCPFARLPRKNISVILSPKKIRSRLVLSRKEAFKAHEDGSVLWRSWHAYARSLRKRPQADDIDWRSSGI
jgi:hypothetical protein